MTYGSRTGKNSKLQVKGWGLHGAHLTDLRGLRACHAQEKLASHQKNTSRFQHVAETLMPRRGVLGVEIGGVPTNPAAHWAPCPRANGALPMPLFMTTPTL